MEQALVEAEMDSEVAGLQQEKDALEAVRDKMTDLETKSQQEKEKVNSQLHFTVEGGQKWDACVDKRWFRYEKSHENVKRLVMICTGTLSAGVDGHVWFLPKEQLCRGFENILINVGDQVGGVNPLMLSLVQIYIC